MTDKIDFSKVIHHSFPVLLQTFADLTSAKSDACSAVLTTNGKWDLVLRLFRGDGQCIQLTVPLNPNNEPKSDNIFAEKRWELVQLSPSVWALAPSVNAGGYHGYIVIRNVPEPAPWAKTKPHLPPEVQP